MRCIQQLVGVLDQAAHHARTPLARGRPLGFFHAATGTHKITEERSRPGRAPGGLRAEAAVERTPRQPLHAGGIARDERRVRGLHHVPAQAPGDVHRVTMSLPKIYHLPGYTE